MSRRLILLLGLFVAVLTGTVCSVTFAVRSMGRMAPRVLERTVHPDGTGSLTVLSRAYNLDRIYMSMTGPASPHPGLTLMEGDEPELVWVTGLDSKVVGLDGESTVSQEFFCHSNLTLDASRSTPDSHNARFDSGANLDWRLFTLVPGRLGVQLPEGFGIPMYSDEALDYYSMSLNQNVTDRTVRVRMRTRIDFVRDEAVSGGMKPLFRRAVYGWEPVAEGDVPACHGGSHPGQSCGPFLGVTASDTGTDTLGAGKTIHWLVAPGTYEARTSVTEQLTLPFDTTVHYVTAHLHPFGRSVILRDVTTDTVLFEIESKDFEDRLGVAHMGEAKFPEGVPLHGDHEYELVTRYENTSGANIDAMSIMYLYLLDEEPGGV